MTLTQINKAGLDELALDHVFTIGASGSSAYTFQGEGLNGTVNNPTLYLTRGKTYRFENGSGGHPIRIQSTSGASGTAYNTGVTNNAGSGTVIVEVQHDAPDVLYYQCTSHAAMNGILYITGALADGGVTTAKIAADAVTGAKIADDAINSEHYTDGSIDTAHIADSQVTNAKLADDAVSTARIADGAVNANKLGSAVVTTAKIEDGAVTDAKIASGISASKITGLSTDSITEGNTEAEVVDTGSDGHFKVTTEGTERLRVIAGGNVGIGTTAPANPLEVRKAAHYTTANSGQARSGIHIRGNHGNAGEYGGGISFGCKNSDGAGDGAAAIAARQGTQDSDVVGLSFFTHPSSAGGDAAQEKLRIHHDGRIQPMYSSTAPATGGVMTVGAFNAKLNGHEPEGLLKARTDISNQSVFDSAGWYDNTNFRYVPQVKGYYIFHVTMMFFTGMSGGSVEQSFSIRLNGTTVHGYTDGYSTNYGNYSKHSFHGVIRCNGNTDYVTVHGSSSASTQLHSASNWSGWLLYPDS